MMHFTRTFARLLAVILAFVSTRELKSAEVMIFAAASLTESLREIGADYQKQVHDSILFNFGGSSTLARQIEQGAPADIFFSADQAQMDRLESKGFIVPDSRRALLSNVLVIVVASEQGAKIGSAKDLARSEIRRIALGDPRAVPIGVYARRYLEKAGLWQAVAPKLVPTENVRGALAAVESGNADASIVYRTDALTSKKVAIACVIPASESPEIRYPVCLVKGTKDSSGSRKFLSYLGSADAWKIFEKYGFIVIRNQTPQ
jgi:molybdate transport system substrate-binding protein